MVFNVRNDRIVPGQEVAKGVEENRFDRKVCTPGRLNKLTGLKLCAELAYPNASQIENAPYFPLTGPSKMAVTVEKADPTLHSYEVHGEAKRTEVENTQRVLPSTCVR